MSVASRQPSIRLQPRDHALLRGLFESRVMTLAHAAALYFDGRSEAAKKRVQRLKTAGLIAERPRRSPFGPSVLFMSAKALKLLGDGGHLDGYPSVIVAGQAKRARVSEATLRHELEVMDVKAAFAGAIKQMPRYCIGAFTTWPALCEFRTIAPDGTPTVVKPDGFVRIVERLADDEHITHESLNGDTYGFSPPPNGTLVSFPNHAPFAKLLFGS